MKRDHLLYGGAAAFVAGVGSMFLSPKAPEALKGVLVFGGLGLFVLGFVGVMAYRFIGLAQRLRDLLRR